MKHVARQALRVNADQRRIAGDHVPQLGYGGIGGILGEIPEFADGRD
jgi:hypothetical protein